MTNDFRERAETVGGILRTGPTDAGGFLIEAALPIQEATGEETTSEVADAPSEATT